jgi:hypothetical protein
MAERLNGVPIIKGSDRYEAGMFALQFNAQLDAGPSTLCPSAWISALVTQDKDILLIDSEDL